ncbi:MAG: hypothetical protein JSU65_07060, partial [Candidatus Zixiibacteriota bacterium]
MYRSVMFSVVLIIMTLPSVSAADGDPGNMQARIYFETKPQVLQLLEMGMDIVSRGDDYLEIVTSPDELDRLQSLGFKTEVIHHNLIEFFSSRIYHRVPSDMGGYKTLDEINTALDTLIMDHASIVSAKISIGQTIEGRDQWAVKISDNPGTDEEEPEILFTAATHAREVITPELLLYFMDYLTEWYGVFPSITELVDSREIWFVLVVNPDGYYHNEVIAPDGGGMWRKNRRDNGDGT